MRRAAFYALLARTGVRVARIDDDRLGAAVGEVLLRDDEGLTFDSVRRIDRGRSARHFGPDESQILLLSILRIPT